MLDVRSSAFPIHEFGWRVKNREPIAFTDSGDMPFARLIGRRTPRMLRLAPGGLVCRHYLIPEEGAEQSYEIALSIDTISSATIPEEHKDTIKQNLLMMLGERWAKAAAWASRLRLAREATKHIVQHLHETEGELPPIRWSRTPADRPTITTDIAKNRLVIVVTEVPEEVPFPICVKRIVERSTADIFRKMVRLPAPAEA